MKNCTDCPLIDRRSFLRSVAFAGVAGALPLVDGTRIGRDEKSYPIPATDGVHIDRDLDVILSRIGGKVFAFNLACPHQNTAIRWDGGKGRFQCPKHKSVYTPEGVFVDGRATRGLDRFTVRTGWELDRRQPGCPAAGRQALRQLEEGLRDDMRDETMEASGACGGCVSRRSFVARSAGMAAVAAFFAACGESGETLITAPTGQVQVKVADFPGLATLDKLVLIDGRRAAKRTGAGTFAAFSRFCTHEGTPVDLADNDTTFLCPNHLSRFDNNGKVTTGPATQGLSVLATSYAAATDTLTIG